MRRASVPDDTAHVSYERSVAAIAAVALVVAGAAFEVAVPALTIAAAALVGVYWKRTQPVLRLLALLAVAIEAAGLVHVAIEERNRSGDEGTRLTARLGEARERLQRLVVLLDSSAARIAALPEAAPALGGDKAALSALFLQLQSLRRETSDRPAVAIHTLPLATIAWSGRVVDLRSFQEIAGVRRDVFILAGRVTTTLVATAPVADARGRVVGLASAELALAVQRNIQNEFLADFDLIAGGHPGLEAHYVDARYERDGPRPFAPVAAGVASRELLLRSPDGGPLAAVRAAAGGLDDLKPLVSAYHRGLSAAALLAFVVWTLAPGLSGRPGWRLALGASAARVSLLALGPPWPLPGAPLLSPDVYASASLGPFSRSPLDLLLTSSWLALLAGLLLASLLARPRGRQSLFHYYGSVLLGLIVLGLTFAWAADTSGNSTIDIESVALLPRSATHLALQASVFLILVLGGLLLTSLLTLGGPVPSRGRALVLWLLGLAALAVAAYRWWPRELLGLPLVPAVVLFGVSMGLAAWPSRWWPHLKHGEPGAVAGIAIGAVAALSLLLYPTLVHYGEKSTRQQIEGEHASQVLRQPQLREYVLGQTQRLVDSLHLLEQAQPGPSPPLIEELAFGVWSASDLAAVGFSSAVEVQDAAGRIVSRFALNLPSLSGPTKTLPSSDDWDTHREALPVTGGGGMVLHSARRLTYHGEIHGAVHVYIRDDFWNLPFIRDRDPYSVLYRTSIRSTSRERPVGMLAYDWKRNLLFSSADRPPALDADLLARLRRSPWGLWTTLPIDDRLHHTFLFSDGLAIYGLSYPRLGTGRFLADLVEASSGMTLAALSALVAVMLLRTVLRRPTLSLPSLATSIASRFSLRLFVAFVAIAVVPVVVLQQVVRVFVVERLRKEAEDDAVERAAVAKKAVEDFVLYRRDEAPARQPGLDAGLVYVASLMRNDLDVFESGRLLASSKRELYASGLLAPRIPGHTYRSIVLEGQLSSLGTERIGGFSYLVVSVPLRLEAGEPGILSIPLALRQREVDAVLEDLERTIRLASVLFLLAAAAVAQSMARRISGPIRALTDATQRIAQGDLSARVSVTSRDELLALVESFNQMARDLDQQRRDLERSNRLAAWAEIARQLAHEIKNPLTPIQLSAEHLRRVYADGGADFGAALETCTQTILKQVRTLRGIVTEFSAFARPPAARLEAHDPRAIVEDVLRPYQAALPPAVELRFVPEDHVPLVVADHRLLGRALVNLIENALQAVGERGSITVHVGASDGHVRFEVADSGPGINPEIRDRVFEPFFSTKTSGSGLGLALVKKIAEDHGGSVTLESDARGTRARLSLPAGVPAPNAGEPQ